MSTRIHYFYHHLKQKICKLFTVRIPGFIGVEIAVLLLIITICATVAMNVLNPCLEQAKKENIASQIICYASAINIFVQTYGDIPGSLKDASQKLCKEVESGNGAHKIDTDQLSQLAWTHLTASGLVSYKKNEFGVPASEFNSYVYIKSDFNGTNGLWLVICGPKESPILDCKIAASLRGLLDNSSEDKNYTICGEAKDGKCTFAYRVC